MVTRSTGNEFNNLIELFDELNREAGRSLQQLRANRQAGNAANNAGDQAQAAQAQTTAQARSANRGASGINFGGALAGAGLGATAIPGALGGAIAGSGILAGAGALGTGVGAALGGIALFTGAVIKASEALGTPAFSDFQIQLQETTYELQKLFAALGEVILPVFTEVLGDFADVVQKFNDTLGVDEAIQDLTNRSFLPGLEYVTRPGEPFQQINANSVGGAPIPGFEGGYVNPEHQRGDDPDGTAIPGVGGYGEDTLLESLLDFVRKPVDATGIPQALFGDYYSYSRAGGALDTAPTPENIQRYIERHETDVFEPLRFDPLTGAQTQSDVITPRRFTAPTDADFSQPQSYFAINVQPQSADVTVSEGANINNSLGNSPHNPIGITWPTQQSRIVVQ